MTQTDNWPPVFTLDQEAILNLLTGDRFYSNPSAALREAVLNAIDAIHRRCDQEIELEPKILVFFNHEKCTLTVSDNGVGMNSNDVTALFTKVGASAAKAEARKDSVGEFGIGVISYFMASDGFTLQTYDGYSEKVGLRFHRGMLAGGSAEIVLPTQPERGTTVTLYLKNEATLNLLIDSYPYWCRDVAGISARVEPSGDSLPQGDYRRATQPLVLEGPSWVERSHLAPVADPTGWDAMTGISTVSVLYRGVFVQEFEVRGLWGIQGSIDVDPKHFKPRLNREGFIAGKFQSEVETFLRSVHPRILEAMAKRLAEAVTSGELDKWSEKQWANLWLSVPRENSYRQAIQAWDDIFRSLPAFEIAAGNKWEPASIKDLLDVKDDIYVAPLADEKPSDLVKAAVRLLRNSGKTVIRGIRKDRNWMRYSGAAFSTTADLITNVFGDKLTALKPINKHAEQILDGIARIAPLFTGPPPIDLVRIGRDGPPALRLAKRLVINIEHPAGSAIVDEVLKTNTGPNSLIEIAARHAYEQLTQVAAVVRNITAEVEILSPVRRRFIRRVLS